MSLRSEPIPIVPKETARVAHAAFPKSNLYLKMRDELGTFYKDADFIGLFSSRGQSAYSPWRLALITVMQFAEGLSDRQAAEAVRARIDWKYALSLELDDAGFDFSILSEFRARLLERDQESVLLEKMLERFQERGWLKARGRQRTDSTHILANVRHLNRLESVTETLRAALNEVAKLAPRWLHERITEECHHTETGKVAFGAKTVAVQHTFEHSARCGVKLQNDVNSIAVILTDLFEQMG